MTKCEMRAALAVHKQRQEQEQRSERVGRLAIADYPWSHNPYVAHELVEDCYAGCIRP
jgi:hypothetical protein